MNYLRRTPSTTLQLCASIIFLLMFASVTASKNYIILVNVALILIFPLLLALIVNLLLSRGFVVLRVLVGICIVLAIGFHIFMWLDFMKNVD